MKEEPYDPRVDLELEARIVALVLGEASDFEREQLQRLIEERPELKALKEQIESVHGLLADVGTGESDGDDDAWKLSADRRSAVLAVIDGEADQHSTKRSVNKLADEPASRDYVWTLLKVAAVICFVLVAGSIAILPMYKDRLSDLGRLSVPSAIVAEKNDTSRDATEFFHESFEHADKFVRPNDNLVSEPATPYFQKAESASDANADYLKQSMPALQAIQDVLDGGVAKERNGSGPSPPQNGNGPVRTDGEPTQSKGIDVDGDGQTESQPTEQVLGGGALDFPRFAQIRGEFEFTDSNKRRATTSVPDPATVWPSQSGFGGFTGGGMSPESGESAGSSPVMDDYADFDHVDEFRGTAGGYAGFEDRSPTSENPLPGGDDGSVNGVEVDGMMMGGGGYGAGAGGGSAGFGDDSIPSRYRSPAPQEQGRQGISQGQRDYRDLSGAAASDSSFGREGGAVNVEGISDAELFDAPSDEAPFAISTMNSANETTAWNKEDSGVSRNEEYAEDVGQSEHNWGITREWNRTSGRQGWEYRPSLEEGGGREIEERVKDSLGKIAEQAEYFREPGSSDGFLSGDTTVLEEVDDRPQSILEGRQAVPRQTLGEPAMGGQNEWYGYVPPTLKYESKHIKKVPVKKRSAMGLNETTAVENAFSTFSLHVSDVSFKLARAALAQGEWPEAAKVRIEEFVNAFDYGDPLPSEREKVSCCLEQTIHPFLQQRNLMRVSIRTAATGRSNNTPLRLTFLLDNSGSMERPDRQQTVRRVFALIARQLKPMDQATLISFARQPRLLADKVGGAQSQQLVHLVENLPSEGGTNIEAGLKLAFEKAREQQVDNAQNRIILLTDGAVNLGDANPDSLSEIISTMRDAGIAFDAAGISAEGLNDEVLEALTRKGDGRYYLLDSPEVADDGFVRQIAGALRPSAKNVKVQVEFNPRRVGHYKLLGFEKHRLKQEDFRDDKVDAAEMAASEAGVAVYQFEAKPDGEGDIGSLSVRFRDLSTGRMIEKRWPIPYEADAPRSDQATPSLRVATSAALLAAKLGGGPLGEAVDLKVLADLIAGLPQRDRSAQRVQQLQQMIQQARAISGK